MYRRCTKSITERVECTGWYSLWTCEEVPGHTTRKKRRTVICLLLVYSMYIFDDVGFSIDKLCQSCKTLKNENIVLRLNIFILFTSKWKEIPFKGPKKWE